MKPLTFAGSKYCGVLRGRVIFELPSAASLPVRKLRIPAVKIQHRQLRWLEDCSRRTSPYVGYHVVFVTVTAADESSSFAAAAQRGIDIMAVNVPLNASMPLLHAEEDIVCTWHNAV